MAPSATSTGGGGTAKLQFDTFQNVINGKTVNSSKTRHGINPATKKPNPEVPVATSQDLDEAVAAATKAFQSWSRTPVEERKKALNSYADAFISYKDEFTKLLTQEQGKPVGLGSRRTRDSRD
jgi:acyl-CoA reductase-like NAD-dependent aldehyde dehydrogenase